MCASPAMRSASAAARRDLPIPGSPEISTTCPSPFQARRLAFQQEIDLVLAADEIGQTSHVDRLEAALGIGYALDRPRCDRLGNTLDLVPAEVTQMKQIAEQPTRGAGDDDRPGLGQGQKAGCEVRRLPDHSVLPQRTLAAKVADHHHPGRDANANRKRFRGARLKSAN